MTDVPPGILNTRLEEIALAPAVEFDPAAARALGGTFADTSGLWIVVQVLSNNRVRLVRAGRDGDAEITAHESMLRPVSRERLLEAFRKSAGIATPAKDDSGRDPAWDVERWLAEQCTHYRTEGNIRCLGTRGHKGLHTNHGVTALEWSDQDGSFIEHCTQCHKPMRGPDEQCHSGICHDCAGCADVHAGHEHTDDPDFTVEGCADCEALVAESKRRFVEERAAERAKEAARLVTIAARIAKARTSCAFRDPATDPMVEPDPEILAAVIIADAIGDLTDAVRRLNDIFEER